MSTVNTDNSRTIARNSFWYALDASASTLVILIASIPVGRVMGPQILGHYIYLLFLTGLAQRLANLGIPATACKYMAEYLGRGEYGIAHEVYRVTLRYQMSIAAIITVIGLALTAFAEDGYRVVAVLVVTSIWPAMVSYIPAQANVAAEDLRANLPGTFAYLGSYTILVICSLVFDWGLLGLASATLVSKASETAVRYWTVHRWIRNYPRQPLGAELFRRMRRFSNLTLMMMVLGMVVWDRSEVLFLKYFCDIKQVAFYSLAFSITNQLLMVPRGFSSSIGITMLAQYGRDAGQLHALLRNATRYVSLLTIPVFVGTAIIAEPLIRITYGHAYLSVVPVLWIMCILSIPRAFQSHTESLLQATENQSFMVKWLVIAAFLNVTFDVLLIPRLGAVGAATANGAAQIIGVLGLLYRAGCMQDMAVQWRFFAGLWLSAAMMSAAVLPLVRIFPPLVGLPLGIVTGAVVFLVGVRLFKVLDAEDRRRLHQFIQRMPRAMQYVGRRVLVLCAVSAPVSESVLAATSGVED